MELNKMKFLKLNGQDREITVENGHRFIQTDDDNRIDLDLKSLIYTSYGTIETALNDVETMIIKNLWEPFNRNLRYYDKTLNNFEIGDNGLLVKKVNEYADQGYFDSSSKIFRSMILYSKLNGVGKTHLLYALSHCWYDNPKVSITGKNETQILVKYVGCKYQVVREEDLMLKIKSTYEFNHDESELDVYEKLNKFDILGIDDVGKYNPSNLEFYRRVMFQIIDTRYNNNKGLVISTNLNPHELTVLLGNAIADRLNEMSKGYQLEFKGKSYRGK